MACILKIPTNNTKGVITFTSEERNKFILRDKRLQQRIIDLKHKWTFGLHHNWHDFKFNYLPIFDFSMAGETDLIEVNNQPFHHVPIECTHFSPSHFEFSTDSLMWDILYVGRAVHFKRIPEFFQIIRDLYDKGLMYRVLFIAPMPPQCADKTPNKSCFCDIREVFEKMFNSEERMLFNLMTIDYEYPFPFDIETLSHFYKSSRIFVYTSDDESRPRTVAYAMASGMPTVLMKSVASLLPKEKQIRPFVFLANSFGEYPELIREAISHTMSDVYTKENMIDGINEFDAGHNLNKLQEILNRKYQIDLFENDKQYSSLNDLNIRLARHHGFGDNSNSIGWSLDSFLNYLEHRSLEDMQEDIRKEDVERYISNLVEFGQKEESSLYKKSFIEHLKYLARRILRL